MGLGERLVLGKKPAAVLHLLSSHGHEVCDALAQPRSAAI